MMFTRPEQCAQYIENLLNAHLGELGINTVVFGEELKTISYPAVMIVPQPMRKEMQGIPTFLCYFNVTLYVYHANLTVSRAQRTLEDMQLATGIVNLLEKNFTLSNNIIFGFVAEESPGILARGDKSEMIIGTRLEWEGQSKYVFRS